MYSKKVKCLICGEIAHGRHLGDCVHGGAGYCYNCTGELPEGWKWLTVKDDTSGELLKREAVPPSIRNLPGAFDKQVELEYAIGRCLMQHYGLLDSGIYDGISKAVDRMLAAGTPGFSAGISKTGVKFSVHIGD